MSKTIFEYVTDNVHSTLAGVTQAQGYNNDLEVARETRLGSGPAPSDANKRYAILVPAEIELRKDRPCNCDDYDQIFWIDCYGFESDDSSMTPDAVGQSIAGDVIKALNIDYNRGNHPADGRALALNTQVRFASPMELSQATFRGVVLRVEVRTRTALNNPLSLP